MAIYTPLKWQHFSLLAALLCVFTNLTPARTPQNSLTRIQSFTLPFPIQGITMSGDEALIAVSMKSEDSASQVQIYDRKTQKPLVKIDSEGKPLEQIRFDHYTRHLALVNAETLQLWNLEEFPSQSDPALSLSPRYLTGEVEHAMPSESEIAFSRHAPALLWGEREQIQQWLFSEKPFQINSLWTGTSESLQSFAFDTHEKWLAYSQINDKRIFLVQPHQKQKKPHLDYHHFPVVQVLFTAPETILSLDTAGNLIWGNANSRLKTHGLFLKNLSPQETTQSVHPLHENQFVIITQNAETSQTAAYLIDKTGTQLEKIPLAHAKSFAASPTGAYLLAASSPNQVDIYQRTPHQKPVDYIQHLRQQGATEMARHYRNHLEKLPTELSTLEEASTGLQSLLDQLNAAIRAERWATVQQWIAKILEKDAQNPQALSAQKLLEQHQDSVLLEQGKGQIQQENFDQAIRVLTQIPKTSAHREEARQLIAEAENNILLQNAVEKSKQEVRLQNWAKAKALLAPVLTQNPNHAEAQALLKEIEAQEQTDSVLNFLTLLAFAGLLGALAVVAFKKRKWLVDWLSLTETESAPLKPPVGRKKLDPLSDNSLEKKKFLDTLEKTKTVLALSKKADRTAKYTARLIDFEAEIAVIRKKASQPKAPYNHLSHQLLHILQTIRGFNFESEPKPSQKQEKPAPPKNQKTNYYQILKVSPDANLEEIKRAYHEQMKAYHPDLHQNSGFDWVKKEAEAKTRLIQEAYDTLKDPQIRRKYDKNFQSQ